MASNREIVPDHCKRNTFTSYVAPPLGDLTANSEWCWPSDMRDVQSAIPRLLSNEQIVVSAPAYMYTRITQETRPQQQYKHQQQFDATETVFGLLSVTNFKLAFVPLHQQQQEQQQHQQQQVVTFNGELYQEQLHLRKHEVTLNNIDVVYMVASNGKRKKLEPQTSNISRRIAALHIICMNFRLLKFAFQLQDSEPSGAHDYGKRIASALALFAYPTRHVLSFAYRYSEPYYSTLGKSSVTMFSSKNDWARELIRCGATEWQVVSAPTVPSTMTTGSGLRYTLPANFVIPKYCAFERYLELCTAFCDNRCAYWVYGYGKASLVRLAELNVPTSGGGQQLDTKCENITLELVRKCDEQRRLHLLQLTDRLPRIHDVQRAFVKFRRLCAPETLRHFVQQEHKFLTALEKSNWLFYVSLCLRYACEAAEKLRAAITCVLQETNGRDLCCVVSSLTQIMLDPYFRTMDGFQSLVQKEWVALEHPFQRRLGHVHVGGDADAEAAAKTDEAQSPVFLLFLDCVWQLQHQFVDEFEFTSTYLTTLWDSCFNPIFDTFQFDSEQQRANAVREQQLILRPVWDWSEQFGEQHKSFFVNPLYQRQQPLVPARRSHQHQQRCAPAIATRNHAPQLGVPKDRYLEPQHRMPDIAVWEQCYYRWLSVLEIYGGGHAAVDLYHRLLLSNIAKLQRSLELQDFNDLPEVYYRLTGESRPGSCSSSCTTEPPIPNECDVGVGAELSSSIEYIDGVERRQKKILQAPAPPPPFNATSLLSSVARLPTVSSFFPFGSGNTQAPQQLIDVLADSNELLLEGSIMERLSVG